MTEFQGMLDPAVHRPVYCFSNHDQWRIVTRRAGEAGAVDSHHATDPAGATDRLLWRRAGHAKYANQA